jgi:hypothetical protein
MIGLSDEEFAEAIINALEGAMIGNAFQVPGVPPEFVTLVTAACDEIRRELPDLVERLKRRGTQ